MSSAAPRWRSRVYVVPWCSCATYGSRTAASCGCTTRHLLRTARSRVWHHGSPQTGGLLEPMRTPRHPRYPGRVVRPRRSYGGRPGAGPGRRVGRDDAEQLVDALGIERFAVMGAFGRRAARARLRRADARPRHGGRDLASLAPFAATFDWFAGMTRRAPCRRPGRGREARTRLRGDGRVRPSAASPPPTGRRWPALEARSARTPGAGGTAGPDGLIDDDVAFAPPGASTRRVSRRSCSCRAARTASSRRARPAPAGRTARRAELWLRPHDGHVSVLEAVPGRDGLARRRGRRHRRGGREAGRLAAADIEAATASTSARSLSGANWTVDPVPAHPQLGRRRRPPARPHLAVLDRLAAAVFHPWRFHPGIHEVMPSWR